MATTRNHKSDRAGDDRTQHALISLSLVPLKQTLRFYAEAQKAALEAISRVAAMGTNPFLSALGGDSDRRRGATKPARANGAGANAPATMTTANPAVAKPATTNRPAAKPVTAKRPATKPASKPSAAKRTAASKPSAAKRTAAAKPTAAKRTAAAKPSATKRTTAAMPASTKRTTAAKPVSTKRSATKPEAAKRAATIATPAKKAAARPTARRATSTSSRPQSAGTRTATKA